MFLHTHTHNKKYHISEWNQEFLLHFDSGQDFVPILNDNNTPNYTNKMEYIWKWIRLTYLNMLEFQTKHFAL